jgi:hypothetical protein
MAGKARPGYVDLPGLTSRQRFGESHTHGDAEPSGSADEERDSQYGHRILLALMCSTVAHFAGKDDGVNYSCPSLE